MLDKDKLEILFLVEMLNKSAELLSIGLGEAGQQVFKSHLKTDFDKILEKGKKVYCVFSFCSILGFQNILNTLGHDVLEFVNSISNIVHHNVYKHLGYGNKNLGSTFLLVWKFHSDELTKISIEYQSHISNIDTRKSTIQSLISRLLPKMNIEKKSVQNKCDVALIGLVKIMVEIHTKEKHYRSTWGVDLNMGFGMHCGWAVEGAIGSYMKMDTR
jgi:class 3 adenylate cyclase